MTSTDKKNQSRYVNKIPGLLHEVWLSTNDNGELLPSCVHFGPAGDEARNFHSTNYRNSVCVWIFWANSHYDAMNIYYQYIDYGEYSTDQKWDFELYPEEWYTEQTEYLLSLNK